MRAVLAEGSMRDADQRADLIGLIGPDWVSDSTVPVNLFSNNNAGLD
jgi:hypothetical protein